MNIYINNWEEFRKAEEFLAIVKGYRWHFGESIPRTDIHGFPLIITTRPNEMVMLTGDAAFAKNYTSVNEVTNNLPDEDPVEHEYKL